MNPCGRISLYVKDMSEEEKDFYFNSYNCQSKLIKSALTHYYNYCAYQDKKRKNEKISKEQWQNHDSS